MKVLHRITTFRRTLATRALLGLACAAMPLVRGPAVLAEPPPIISYQGRVKVSGLDFTGTGRFRFALVSPDGRESFWSHDGTSTAGNAPGTSIDLPVANGLYSVLLGDASVSGMTSPMPAGVFARSNDVRLRVWFDDGAHGVQQLAPDARLTSVGYALAATQLTGLISESNIPPGGITARSLGDQSITPSKLAPGAVVTGSLADGAVTSAKVAGGAIGPAQIAQGYGLWKQGVTGLFYDGGNVDIGVGGNRGTAPLHVTSGPAYLNSMFEGDNNYGTWLSLANNSPGGTNWIIQSSGAQRITGTAPGSLSVSLSLARGVTSDSLFTVTPSGTVGINSPVPRAPLQVQSPKGDGDILLVGGDNRSGGATALSLGVTARSGGRPYIQGVSSAGSSYGVLALNPDAGNVVVAPWGAVSLAGAGAGVGIGLGDRPPTAGLQVDSLTGWVNTLLDSSSPLGTWLSLRNSSNRGTNWVLASAGADTWSGMDPGTFVIGNSYTRATLTHIGLALTPSGNLGVGMVKPSAPLHIGSLGSAGAAIRIGGDPAVKSTSLLDIGLTQSANGNPYIQGVSSSGTDYGLTMINPFGGRLQVGPQNIQTPTASFHVHQVSGTDTCAVFSNNSGTLLMKVGTGSYSLLVDGEAHKTNGNPFWNTTSDERLKTEIETLGSALGLINRVRPVTFRYSPAHRAANPGIPDTRQFGVVAQEFAQVFPDFVTTNRDGFLSVNSSPLIFANTAAIQELNAQVKARDTRIQQLESRVDELQSSVTRLEAARDSVAALTGQVQALQLQLTQLVRTSGRQVASNP